jgi:hypothetical protein
MPIVLPPEGGCLVPPEFGGVTPTLDGGGVGFAGLLPAFFRAVKLPDPLLLPYPAQFAKPVLLPSVHSTPLEPVAEV